jgi:lipopolysaccharide export system protein LptC
MNKEMIIKQLESMLRTLDFIKEEQAYIKGKLSILLEHNVIETVVSWAEDLQQQILNRESAVQLLKNDIVSLDRLVKLQSPQSFSIDNLLMGKLKKFKEQIVYLENNFMQWKHEVDLKLELPSIN